MRYASIKRNWFDNLYDNICRALTEYEEGSVDCENLYRSLVEIQNLMCNAEIDEDEDGFKATFRCGF